MKKTLKRVSFLFLVLIITGFCLPENFTVPVKSASKGDYNQKSFWAYPWGKSITHKGVDIFAKSGTAALSSIDGFVLKRGTSDRAGIYVVVISAKWRVHYYAHLASSMAKIGQWVSSGDQIGTVGATGNAAGKTPHLHYSIYSPIPLPWKGDKSIMGWKKMFFMNPITYLNEALSKNSSVLSSE